MAFQRTMSTGELARRNGQSKQKREAEKKSEPVTEKSWSHIRHPPLHSHSQSERPS